MAIMRPSEGCLGETSFPTGVSVNATNSVAYSPAWFDPLSTEQIANTICEIFERQPLISLESEIPKFEGSGLYALYYRGVNVELYVRLSGYQIPVYVGQARSSSSATGKQVRARYPLHGRLKQHRLSILQSGLPSADFGFRALLMPDVHADLGENALRVGYTPIWNSILTGFGSHEQGGKTRQSAKSKWDTVHGGRRRTHGSDSHDGENLRVEVTEHIEKQLRGYAHMSWRHPSSDAGDMVVIA